MQALVDPTTTLNDPWPTFPPITLIPEIIEKPEVAQRSGYIARVDLSRSPGTRLPSLASPCLHQDFRSEIEPYDKICILRMMLA